MLSDKLFMQYYNDQLGIEKKSSSRWKSGLKSEKKPL